MGVGYVVNAIRSSQIDLGPLACFELYVECSYDECKRAIHGVCINLLLNKELCTYEMRSESKNLTYVKVYLSSKDSIKFLNDRLGKSVKIRGEVKYVGKRRPTYVATENFFDLLVDVAIRKVGFKYVRGSGGRLIDPNDLSKALEKRTVIEVRSDSGKQRYYGILFIDYRLINQSSVAEKLLSGLNIDDFERLKEDSDLRKVALEKSYSLIGKSVLTLVKDKYIYGEIIDIDPVFASERKFRYGDTEKSVYEIWLERYKKGIIRYKPSPWEYPLFIVRRKDGRGNPTYPPSVLRLIEGTEGPDPATKWDSIKAYVRLIEGELKDLYRELTGKEIKFRYIRFDLKSPNIGFKLNFYTGTNEEKPLIKKVVRLRYRVGNEDKDLRISPLVAFDSRKCEPYAGKQSISLIIIYPSTLVVSHLSSFINELRSRFSKLNLGSIVSTKEFPYDYEPENLSESLTSLEAKLNSILSSDTYSKDKHLPLVVIPDSEEFYRLTKEVASSNGYHTQVVTMEVLEEIIDLLSIIESEDASEDAKRKASKMLNSMLANLCGGIYVEYLIQKKVAKKGIAGPLTWILTDPADGVGESMYVGLDVSTKKGVAGAAFIMMDPYGELVDAKVVQTRTELLSYDDYYDILRYMISKARERGFKRIVILRDGAPKSNDEVKACLSAYKRLTKELNYHVKLDYVAVIKRAPVRLFEKVSGGGTVKNPVQGTYVYAYKLKHWGYYAHEVFIIASKPEESEESSGTARPVVLRIYELTCKYGLREIKRIAEEYLALTRLNFWNLVTGASKLAIPVKMADTLSYLLALRVPIKV